MSVMQHAFRANVGTETPNKNPIGEAGSRGSSPGSTSAGSSLSPGSSAALPRDCTPSAKAIGPKQAFLRGFGDLEPMPAYIEGTLLQQPAVKPALHGCSDWSASQGGLLEPRYVGGDESLAQAALAVRVKAGHQQLASLRSSALESFVGQTFSAAAAECGALGLATAECAVVPGPHPGLATSVVQPIAVLLPSDAMKAAETTMSVPWHPEAGSRIAPGVSSWPLSTAIAALPHPASPALQLDLAEALPEPKLGSPEKPTLGSATHRFGNCKPCAFLYTKGCMNGLECPFCHLCGAGEKKRRQKEKKEQKRELNKWTENQVAALNNLGVFASTVPR